MDVHSRYLFSWTDVDEVLSELRQLD